MSRLRKLRRGLNWILSDRMEERSSWSSSSYAGASGCVLANDRKSDDEADDEMLLCADRRLGVLLIECDPSLNRLSRYAGLLPVAGDGSAIVAVLVAIEIDVGMSLI